MSLTGVIMTVKVQQTNSHLIVTVPSVAAKALFIHKGDKLIVRLVGKDLRYRKVE